MISFNKNIGEKLSTAMAIELEYLKVHVNTKYI